MRAFGVLFLLLVSCADTKADSATNAVSTVIAVPKADPMGESEYGTVDGVAYRIEECLGFGAEWDDWLNTRQQEGWKTIYASERRDDDGRINLKTIRLKKNDRIITSYLNFYYEPFTKIEGRCDFNVETQTPENRKLLEASVRDKMGRVRPDWNAITYFSDDYKLSFNAYNFDGSSQTLIVMVGYDYRDTAALLPK